MVDLAVLKPVGYFIIWCFIGIINFVAAVRLEGLDSEAVEQNDKIFAIIVVAWPLMTVSMIVWAFRKIKNGKSIKVGDKEVEVG